MKRKPVPVKRKTATAPGKGEPAGKRKLILFRTISILTPLLFVLLLELILRIAGYGHSYSLFDEYPANPAYWEMSEYASYKFFTNEENATYGNIELFAKKKAPETYRIFVLGESTTIGFPYLHNGSFHRWLKYRLMFTFPEKNFEIINLSLTAVNSYTVLDFARKISRYEPDAVLIYVGHNEYYGALGVGSTSYMGSNPKIVRQLIRLRKLRIYQLLNSTVNGMRKKVAGQQVDSNAGLMVRMPAKTEIGLGSKTYQRGVRQFSENMNKACSYLSDRDIPVFISNLVSNEKDLSPFISDNSDPGNSADRFYRLGEEAFSKGEYGAAREYYVKAKELDLLRFRAPEAINEEISALAGKYKGVYLVDARALFEKNSAGGILGKETLLEHVHPNLFGYALLSDAFYETMKKEQLIATVWGDVMTFDELLEEMPVTILDSLYGEYVAKFMFNSWPFTHDPLPIERLVNTRSAVDQLVHKLFFEEIRWLEATNQLLRIYQDSGNTRGMLKIFEAFSLEQPSVEQHLRAAMKYSVDLSDTDRAIFYGSRLFKMRPGMEDARQMSNLCLNADRPGQARDYLLYIQANELSRSNIPAIIGIVDQIIELKGELEEGRDPMAVLNNIALNYVRIGAVTAARKYLYPVLKNDPENKMALATFSVIRQVEAGMPDAGKTN